MTRGTATALAFAPSLLAGLIGAIWWWLDPPGRAATWPWLPSLLLGAAAGGGLLAAGALMERHVRSFARVSRATERALARLAPSPWTATLLAIGTSLGEELLFRGILLDKIGLIGQALAFGALHPAGRKGWSYPVFTAAAGLALGGLVLLTGRLAPAVVAHLVVNAVGLLGARRTWRDVHGPEVRSMRRPR